VCPHLGLWRSFTRSPPSKAQDRTAFQRTGSLGYLKITPRSADYASFLPHPLNSSLDITPMLSRDSSLSRPIITTLWDELPGSLCSIPCRDIHPAFNACGNQGFLMQVKAVGLWGYLVLSLWKSGATGRLPHTSSWAWCTFYRQPNRWTACNGAGVHSLRNGWNLFLSTATL
jgi:hypothetical protein